MMGLHRVIQPVVTMSLLVVTVVFLYGCSKDEDSPYDPNYAERRTVMVYMVAENSLNGNVAADVNEMLEGMRDNALYESDRLVIYLDDVGKPRIYEMNRSTSSQKLSDLTPVKTYDEDVNSASPQQLGSFIAYAKSHYPADSYGLVLWSHASGWIPFSDSSDRRQVAQIGNGSVSNASSSYRRRYSFGLDNEKNTSSKGVGGYEMDIDEMVQVIQEQGGVDFILFDACLMQSVEVAYELRHATQYIVASPAEIPYFGAEYASMVKAMFRKNDYVQQMVSAYYNAYSTLPMRNMYGSVISAIKTSELESFAAYMRPILKVHQETLSQFTSNSTLNYFHYDQWGYYPDAFDIQGVMKRILTESDFNTWKEQLAKIMAVPCMYTPSWYSAYPSSMIPVDDSECSGVSMYIPLEKYSSSYNNAYYQMEWGKFVWKE